MRRLTRVLTLTCLFLVATVAAMAAQSSAGEDAVTRTVEIPGTGLAATLPAEWRIWLAEEAGHPTEIMATDVAARRTCNFSPVEGVGSAEAAAHDAVEKLDAHRDIEVVERAFLIVPAGNAVRVSYRYKTMPDEPRFVFHDYYLDAGDGVAWFVCSGGEPPGDDWVHIAEAIAPTSADPPASAPFDPRVEVPDHGFAVDLGAEWLVRPWGGRGPVLKGASVLRATTTVSGEDGPASSECWVEDGGGLTRLARQGALSEWLEARLEGAFSPPWTPEGDLPFRPADRVDGEWNRMLATAWPFTDGDRRMALICRSEDPPPDRWLSIAETFEFLPAEE
jgi:hypothetical protein